MIKILSYNHTQDKFEQAQNLNIPKGYALIEVKAFGINRADVLQKMGKYPVTPDMPSVLGLEISGEVIAINIDGLKDNEINIINPFNINVKDRVMCILMGGGYASHILVPLNQCITIPQHLSYIEAAALPEAIFTVWHSLFSITNLKNNLNQKEKTIYINAASSGIGTMAIQMCLAFGFTVIASTSSMQKLEHLKSMMNSKKHNNLHIFCTQEQTLAEICTNYNLAIDFCLDMLGDINMLLPNMNMLSKITCIAFLQGIKPTINIATIMQKQINIIGTMLRLQTTEQKNMLTQEIVENILPHLNKKKIKPIIEQVYAKEAINQAHIDLMTNQHIGKLVVDMGI